jgi:prevent-host-death family protein
MYDCRLNMERGTVKITKLSSREFNQDVSKAKRAADKGPVVITDRGEPAYVLMRHEAYKRLAGKEQPLLEALYYPGADDVEFETPSRNDKAFRPVDLS